MASVRRATGVLLWGFAGIPIVGTALQAAFAFSPRRAGELLVLGPISEGFRRIEVLDRAALAFEADPAVVFAALAVVALAWVLVGVSMWRKARRAAVVAAGVVSTFVIPFVVAYGQLLSAPIPRTHLAGFLSIAVMAVGATWAGILLFWRAGESNGADVPSSDPDEKTPLKTAERDLGVSSNPCMSSSNVDLRIEATIERTERRLDRTESQLGRVPGALGRRLRDRLLDPSPAAPAQGDSAHLVSHAGIRERLDGARSHLGDGNVDTAERIATEASTDAARLLESAEFFVDLARTMAGGGDRIRIPESIPGPLADDVVPLVERTYGIDCRIESGTFLFPSDGREETTSSVRVGDDRGFDRPMETHAK